MPAVSGWGVVAVAATLAAAGGWLLAGGCVVVAGVAGVAAGGVAGLCVRCADSRTWLAGRTASAAAADPLTNGITLKAMPATVAASSAAAAKGLSFMGSAGFHRRALAATRVSFEGSVAFIRRAAALRLSFMEAFAFLRPPSALRGVRD
jgi:hypothetical protein